MLAGAVGACVFNLAFGLGAYLGFLGTGPVLLAYLASVWTLNMYFQSYSALALIKVNSGWFHVSERGVFSAIFGSMIQSGRAAVFWLMTTALVVALPWQWKFFLPAGIVAVMAFVTWKVVRKGFEEWFPRYMQEAQHLRLDHPVFKAGAFAVVLAGIAGALASGSLSDWVFKSRRPPVAFIGYALQIGCLAVIWAHPTLPAIIVAFTVNSFAISMVHSMLSGTASMDFGGQRAAASAAGMFDGMQYIGGSFVGFGMGLMLDRYGWGAWAPSMIGFAGIGAVLMLALWNARPAQHRAFGAAGAATQDAATRST